MVISIIVTVFFFIYIFFLAHFHFPASGQAVVTGVIPSPPRFLPSIFIAHRVQQSHCSSIVRRMLLTHYYSVLNSSVFHYIMVELTAEVLEDNRKGTLNEP